MVKQFLIGAALAAAAVAPAQATTVFNLGAPTGETESPGSYSYNFNAGSGAGSLSFQIQGYRTLDGVNCCTDTLTVALNGVTLLNGSYGLGGGGSDVTNTQAAGSTLNVNNGARTIDFSSVVTLLNGANVLSFSYAGAPQGLGDEAWGINSAVVSGNAFAAVPEPSVWALLILGFGLVGGALRSQRKARVALSYS